MIKSLHWTSDGELSEDLEPAAFGQALADAEALLWVDLFREPAEVSRQILRDAFEFHPLAVDDALEERHVPRVDDWGAYLYVVLHAVSFDAAAQEEPLAAVELDIFLGPNYVVTHHVRPIPALTRVWSGCSEGACLGIPRGPVSSTVDNAAHLSAPYLLYRIADEMVTDTAPVIEEIDDRIDAIEDQVFADPTRATLQATFTLRRALLRLRRVLGPQRDVFRTLAHADYAAVPSDEQVFFRDTYDQLLRLHQVGEGLRDLADGALETYLSVVNYRMNEVMKLLAVITTLFLPLSFLAGFFGMNFFQPAAPLDAWTSRPALYIMLATMVLSPAAMAIWMRRRGWL